MLMFSSKVGRSSVCSTVQSGDMDARVVVECTKIPKLKRSVNFINKNHDRKY